MLRGTTVAQEAIMHISTPWVTCSLLVVGALELASASSASACSPPICRPSRVVLGDHTLPRNLAALPVTASGTRLSDPDDASDITLTTAAGVPVAATVTVDPDTAHGFLVVPTAPLTMGSHVLRVLERCPATVGGVPTVVDHPFTVGAEASVPAMLGTVSAHRLGVQEVSVASSSGICSTAIQAAVATVTLAPSAESIPFAALARYTLLIDGTVWAASDFGSFDTSSLFPHVSRSVQRVFAACGTTGSLDDRGTTPGLHQAELRMHVAGAASDPPAVRFSIDVSCETGPADAGTSDAQSADASTPDAQSADAGTPDAAAEVNDEDHGCRALADGTPSDTPAIHRAACATPPGGCSVVAGSTKTGSLLALGLIFAAAVRRRRAR